MQVDTGDGKQAKLKDYPRHPVCLDGELHFDADCEEDSDWTYVILIVSLLAFVLVLIPVLKYVKEFKTYQSNKAQGMMYNSKGDLVDADGQVVEENPVADD